MCNITVQYYIGDSEIQNVLLLQKYKLLTNIPLDIYMQGIYFQSMFYGTCSKILFGNN
jgi:hypothetical protein